MLGKLVTAPDLLDLGWEEEKLGPAYSQPVTPSDSKPPFSRYFRFHLTPSQILLERETSFLFLLKSVFSNGDVSSFCVFLTTSHVCL